MRYERAIQMRAEVKADCYAGESCDQIGDNYFNVFCEGDKQDSDDSDDIVIRCKDLPPGAVVTVEYPCCPECGIPRFDKLDWGNDGRWRIVGHEERCDCGFDWEDWVREVYS